MLGSSARLVARYRPPVPIYAFTHSEAVARQLAIIYGVIPMLVPNPVDTDLFVPGEPAPLVAAKSGHPNFEAIIAALVSGEAERDEVVRLFDVTQTVAERFQSTSEM